MKLQEAKEQLRKDFGAAKEQLREEKENFRKERGEANEFYAMKEGEPKEATEAKRKWVVFGIVLDVIIAAICFASVVGIPVGVLFAYMAYRSYNKHIRKAGA